MDSQPHRRRPRYRGRNPRSFHEKYKELEPDPETVRKVMESGKTPAGTHRPIMVREILEVLALEPGDYVVDCTLGYGGHAEAMLPRVLPGGHLLGLDIDPVEQPRTVQRLQAAGFGPDVFSWRKSNFAGLEALLGQLHPEGADAILADLGVSSMQIDNPARGFSVKAAGPLDMRMNPEHGVPASLFLEQVSVEELAVLLSVNSDEPRAELLARQLAGRTFGTTAELKQAVARSVPESVAEETVRRVFQAIRIAVNDEFGALNTFLRHLPFCLKAGGRVAIVTFHSGEARRVKQAFRQGQREGLYAAIADEVIRADAEERRANVRSTSAKLRWAVRTGAS